MSWDKRPAASPCRPLRKMAPRALLFDAACKELRDTGQPEIVREVIAQRIIELAKTGEFDPVRLREAALVGLKGKGD